MSLSTIAHISISATTEVEITTPCAETRDRDRNGGKWLVEDPPCSPFLMSTAVAAHLPCCNNVAQAQRCRAATQSLYCRRHHHDRKLVAAPPYIPWITSWSKISALHDPVWAPNHWFHCIHVRGDISLQGGQVDAWQACPTGASSMFRQCARLLLSIASPDSY